VGRANSGSESSLQAFIRSTCQTSKFQHQEKETIVKILGILLIVIGLIDFGGSYAGFDLWGGFLGIQLPELLWKFSAYIEMIIGYFLFNLGSKSDEGEESVASAE
jgi:hypothetical protein